MNDSEYIPPPIPASEPVEVGTVPSGWSRPITAAEVAAIVAARDEAERVRENVGRKS